MADMLNTIGLGITMGTKALGQGGGPVTPPPPPGPPNLASVAGSGSLVPIAPPTRAKGFSSTVLGGQASPAITARKTLLGQ